MLMSAGNRRASVFYRDNVGSYAVLAGQAFGTCSCLLYRTVTAQIYPVPYPFFLDGNTAYLGCNAFLPPSGSFFFRPVSVAIRGYLQYKVCFCSCFLSDFFLRFSFRSGRRGFFNRPGRQRCGFYGFFWFRLSSRSLGRLSALGITGDFMTAAYGLLRQRLHNAGTAAGLCGIRSQRACLSAGGYRRKCRLNRIIRHLDFRCLGRCGAVKPVQYSKVSVRYAASAYKLSSHPESHDKGPEQYTEG